MYSSMQRDWFIRPTTTAVFTFSNSRLEAIQVLNVATNRGNM
jgi:hypothetical protein